MSSDEEIEKMIKDQGADVAPRGTVDSIKAKIDTVLYMRDSYTAFTVCKIGMKNGFQFVGTSGAASPKNYNKEIGDKIAYDNAFKQIWSHEGYVLKEVLHQIAVVNARAAAEEYS